MAQPQLVVRVAANLADLKKGLKETESAIQVTSAQAQKLATSFNGDRMITHAKNVTAAIREVGVTTLTASQSARNLDLLERAMDKMRLTSQPIPENMKRTAEQLRFMSRAADSAVPAGQQVSQVYRQFDGVLQSMGVNIGPYVKGLEDVTTAVGGMSTAVGGATTAVGLLTGAVAVFAVGFAALKFGQRVGEVTGWTDAIARGTAVLKGYGDVQQETAMAVADANDLAGQAEINWRRQAESVAASTKAAQDQSDALRENWRVTDGNKDAMARLTQQLEAAKQKRLEDARATFAASQAQSIFKDDTKAATVAVVEQTAALDARAESMHRIADTAIASQQRVDDFMRASTLNDRAASEVSGDVPALNGHALANVVNRFRQAGDQSDAQALQRAIEALSKTEGTVAPKDNLQFFAMQRDQLLLAQLRALKGTIPGFAGGVNDFGGGLAMVGERGPEMVRLPSGSDVIPNHQLGGAVINVTVNVSGAIVGTVRDLSDQLGREFMKTMRGQGFRAPVGA